jgi:hypothetical protein
MSIVPDKRGRNIVVAETIGLIIVAVVILVITLVRYGGKIHWSLR